MRLFARKRMRKLLSELWNDYADSHTWVGLDEVRFTGFEDGKIREYARRLNALGIEADPDAKLAEAFREYHEKGHGE